MIVLKRDGYRCKICGRSPKDYVDIELHVHHIIPWGDGAITDLDNLITLCKTCHDGLDPHRELTLFSLIDVDMRQDIIEERRNYLTGVWRYRKMIIKRISENQATK
jgi:predicted restriction endonuclease